MYILSRSYLVNILIVPSFQRGIITSNYALYLTDIDGSNYITGRWFFCTHSQSSPKVTHWYSYNAIYGIYLVYYVEKSVQRQEHHI